MPKKASTTESPRFETIKQAASRNAISKDTIRRRIASGELTAYRLGDRIIRLNPGEVDELFRPISAVQGRRA
jgi:excisionase family DNA binding protein